MDKTIWILCSAVADEGEEEEEEEGEDKAKMFDIDFMLEEEDFDVSNITLVADFVSEWSKSETFGGEVVWVSL